MTVSESIIRWLKTFDPAEYRKMKKIDTDIQSANADSYTLIKEPVRNVKPYISGRKVYTDHYMIMARLPSQSNTDRIENTGFGEALEGWVRDQDLKENYPELTGAIVSKISVTTPFYIGSTNTNDSLYQMTVAIEYRKE